MPKARCRQNILSVVQKTESKKEPEAIWWE